MAQALFTWTFENLQAGQTAVAPVEMLASSPRNFGVAMEWTLVPLSGTADIEVLSAKLELALEGPSEVNFGEANTYRLHVRNPGNADATDVAVKLSAEPYGASTSEIGIIPAGSSEVIEVELTFNQKGLINIAALANAAGELSTSTKIAVLVKQPKLVATIKAPSTVYHGSSTTYHIAVTNSGDAEALGLTADFTLPAGAEIVEMPAGAVFKDGRLSWPIAVLRIGATEEADLLLNLTTEGENQLELTCSTASGASTQCFAAVRVEAIVDLKLLVNKPACSCTGWR